MRWYEISSLDSTDDIHCLIMYFIRHQDGSGVLYCAAAKGHTELARLLLERGADVNASNKVSNMI